MPVRWQNWMTVLLGFWLAVSPAQMGYSLNHSASGNACGLGAVLIIFNLIAVARILDEGQEIVNILIGLWLILSPFALDFTIQKKPAFNAIMVGTVIIALAAWQTYDAIKTRKKD